MSHDPVARATALQQDLQTKRDRAADRRLGLLDTRKKISFAAHGEQDERAQAQLRRVIADISAAESDIESLDDGGSSRSPSVIASLRPSSTPR